MDHYLREKQININDKRKKILLIVKEGNVPLGTTNIILHLTLSMQNTI